MSKEGKMTTDKNKKMIIVAIVAFFYGIYRATRLYPSILIFLKDPFCLDYLKVKVERGIIPQSVFPKFLLYINFDFFLILFFSLALIVFSIFLVKNRYWAKKTMFYLSSFLLLYALVEPSFFPWIEVTIIQEIISATSILSKLSKIVYYYHHIPLYLFFIIACYPFGKNK